MFSKFPGFKDLKSDPCNVIAQEKESSKPMKYHTENFFDIPSVDYRGINFHDGFGVPVDIVDAGSEVRIGKIVKNNLPQNLPALPLSTISNHYRGIRNTIKEDNIKPVMSRELKQCQEYDKDTPFYTRHFPIFDSLPVTPNSCWENVVQRGTEFRQGSDSRHSKKSH